MARRDISPQAKQPSLPYRVIIDFLEGTTRRKDAVAFAKGFIEQHFDSPQAAGWYVARYEDGYAFEVHEGGSGRAYLPDVLDTLSRNQDVTVAIRMARRMMEIKRTQTGEYTAILLPEGMDPTEEDTHFAEPGPSLTRYRSDGIPLFAAGLATFAVGALAFILSLGVYAVGALDRITTGSGIMDPGTLPISRWEEVLLNAEPDEYVSSLRLENGAWQIERARREVVGKTFAVPQLQPLKSEVVVRDRGGVMRKIEPTSTRAPYAILVDIPRLYGETPAANGDTPPSPGDR